MRSYEVEVCPLGHPFSSQRGLLYQNSDHSVPFYRSAVTNIVHSLLLYKGPGFCHVVLHFHQGLGHSMNWLYIQSITLFWTSYRRSLSVASFSPLYKIPILCLFRYILYTCTSVLTENTMWIFFPLCRLLSVTTAFHIFVNRKCHNEQC